MSEEKKKFFLKSFPLSLEDAKKIFSYCPETGSLKKLRRNGEWSEVSCLSGGYLVTCVRGKNYRAHRIAWFLFYGEWPNNIIDHANGIPTDNKIENLRISNFSLNASNRKLDSSNKSGKTGVYLEKKSGKWVAVISENGKRTRLGYYPDKEAAYAAYKEKSLQLYGYFSCTNREDRKDAIYA